MHKAHLELTEQELNDSIDLFISVLADQMTLLNDPDAIAAVNRLNKVSVLFVRLLCYTCVSLIGK